MATLVRHYEAIMIANSELGEEAISKLQGQFSETVTRHGGQVLEFVPLGKRKFSYKIGRANEGNYLQVRLQMPPAEMAGLKKVVSLMESIVRFMVVRELPSLRSARPVINASELKTDPRDPGTEEIDHG